MEHIKFLDINDIQYIGMVACVINTVNINYWGTYAGCGSYCDCWLTSWSVLRLITWHCASTCSFITGCRTRFTINLAAFTRCIISKGKIFRFAICHNINWFKLKFLVNWTGFSLLYNEMKNVYLVMAPFFLV